jgi:large subunit ribosomal protein L21
MYAIVNISGKQFRVSPEQKIYVPLLDQEVGQTVEFSDVRMFSDENGVIVGTPTVGQTSVKATVLEHMKDDKVIVFKKKRRKGFRRMRGHRQQFTQISIDSIVKG